MRTAIAMAVLLGSAVPSRAQTPKFEFGKAEEVEKVKDVEWNASAEAGVVFTTGNAETTTISAGLKAARKTGNNKLSLEGSLTYARSGLRVLSDLDGNGMIDSEDEIRTESTTTAQTLASKIRYDRFLTRFNSLFVAGLAGRDLPAGKEAVLGGQVGYSRQLHKTKRSEVVAELGYDFSHEDLATGDSISIHSARGFVGFKSEMTEGATVDSSLEALTNLNKENLATCPAATGAAASSEECDQFGAIGRDTRLNMKTAISAKVGNNLAVQTSIEVRYDHRPGPLVIKHLATDFVPEASSLDTIMKASLIYTIF
jgi:hypothetical protein